MNNQEAIKSLKNIIEYWTYKPTEVEAAKLAIEALEKQITNGWIPVKERLPEEPSQRVLVTLRNEMVLEVWYINNEFKHHEALGRGGLEKVSEYNPVIAWQLLPEPYTEVSNDN